MNRLKSQITEEEKKEWGNPFDQADFLTTSLIDLVKKSCWLFPTLILIALISGAFWGKISRKSQGQNPPIHPCYPKFYLQSNKSSNHDNVYP